MRIIAAVGAMRYDPPTVTETADHFAARSLPVWPLLLLVVLSLTGRMLSFSDLYDNAQPGPIAHMIDITEHGRWQMQREPSGQLATKPPLYPWLGALAVMVTRQTDEWVFKLPVILAFLAATWLVYDLGCRSLGRDVGLLAAVFWVANYHCFKLMYTARTDMIVGAWMIAGLWAVQVQRETWTRNNAEAKSPLGLIAIFWLSIGLGLLTKGPPAAIPLAWLLIAIYADGAWKKCRPAWQLSGLLLAAGIMLAWLLPAIDAHPQWLTNINREVIERTTGTGSGAHRHTPAMAIPAYFLGRFAPWSVLCVLALIYFRGWPIEFRNKVRWAIGWTALVLIIFMIPRGKRADYIVPAYAGGAVLAAAAVEHARRSSGLMIGIFLGGVGIAGIAGFFVALLNLPQPISIGPAGIVIEPVAARVVMITFGVVALAGGALTLAWPRPPQYLPKALAASLAVVGLLGIYQTAYSPAAKSRAGESIRLVADLAVEEHQREDLPMVFLDVNKLPVQALANNNDMATETSIDDADYGAVLVISERAWLPVADRFMGRSQVLVRTDVLPESRIRMLLIRIDQRH